MIPYGRQSIGEDDIAAVVGAMRSPHLTQGPRVEEFERALAESSGARYAVVVNSGTAALHAAFAAVNLQAGDEIITSPITFPATTNAAIWQGARPVFVDVDPATGNINPDLIEQKITPRTKAIVPIDYTGRPADLARIKKIAVSHNLLVIEDACQALGASCNGEQIGAVSDLTTFSFHPVKSIATGEGGAALTNNDSYYQRLKRFITHGVAKTDFEYPSPGDWYFEMQELGQNYRLTDLQCALGLSQLKKLDSFIKARRSIVERYNAAFASPQAFETPPAETPDIRSAWHLYVIKLRPPFVSQKAEIFRRLRAAGIGVQVHHIPVYYHPYYQKLGYRRGLCPVAESFYDAAISLPLFPDLTRLDQDYVIKTLRRLLQKIVPE